MPRAPDARDLLLEALLLRAHFGLAGLELALSHSRFRFGAVEDFLRHQRLRVEARQPLKVLFGQVQVGASGLDRDPGASHRFSSRGEPGLAELDGALEVLGIDLKKELAFLHRVAFFHGELRHPPHGIGADVHELFRLDFPRRGDEGLQVPSNDGFDLDLGKSLSLLVEISSHRARNDECRDDPEDRAFLLGHRPIIHYRCPLRFEPLSSQSARE